MEKDTEIKTVEKEKKIKEAKQRKAADAKVKKTEENSSKLGWSEEAKPLDSSPKGQSKKEIFAKPQEKKEESTGKEKIEPKTEVKLEQKKTTEAKSSSIKKKQESKKPKKTEAIVRIENLPISTKKALAICKFIKGKTISQAIKDLEQVISLKKAVPVKGEYAHRKGKMMAGKYPQRAAKNFITLLKSLVANSSDLQEPIIYEAIANIGSRPYGRFGQIRKKRTHVFIKALEKKEIKQKTQKKIKTQWKKEK